MPVPKGYTLDPPQTQLPAGYTLDAPAAPSVAGLAPGQSLPGVPSAPIPAGLQGPPPKTPSGAWQTLNTPIADLSATGRAESQKLNDLQDGPKTLADLNWRTQHPVQDVTRQYLAGVEQRASDLATPISAGMAALSGGAGNLVSKIPLVSKLLPVAKIAIPAAFGAQGAGQLYHAATHPEMDSDARMREALSGGAGLAGGVAGLASSAAPTIAGKVMTGAGNAMQDVGARVINHTVGALTKDFKRGANPGQGYFQAGFGPSWSMDSIASKAADAHEATGAKLGSLYDSATKQGVTIPATKAAAAIQGPVQDARSVISGPGGTGNTEPIDTFASSFKPSLQNAEQAGGYTPSELFGVKRNVAKNTSWGDPNQVGLKDVQQQTVGRLGGVLTDAVPDAGPLNSQYQNLYSLSDRAGQRAMTGSSPLTKIMAKASLGAGGALAGSAVSPTAGIALGLGAMALDSVPAKTTFASGLYYGGRGVAAIGNKLQSLYSPSPAAPTGASFAFDQKAPPRLESSVPGNAGYGQDFSKGGYAGRPPIVPNAPEDLYRLPAATTPGETQPMLGNYIKRGGDVYGPEARTRIVPNKPISRTLQPQTQGLQLPQGAAQPLQLPAAASPGEAQPMVMQAKPTYPPLAQDFAKTRIIPNRTPIPTVKPTGGMTVDLYGNMKPNLNPVLELPAPRPKVAAKPPKK